MALVLGNVCFIAFEVCFDVADKMKLKKKFGDNRLLPFSNCIVLGDAWNNHYKEKMVYRSLGLANRKDSWYSKGPFNAFISFCFL